MSTSPMKINIKNNINIVGREFFQVFLVTYLLLTLAETWRQGFVSNFFNMNWLLLVVLVSGVAMVLTEPAESVRKFRKRTARAVVVLTIRQERREFIKRQQAAMAARQQQLKQQRVTDLRAVASRVLPQKAQPKQVRPNTSKPKRRMDGFF
jgi:hypothetical protein